MALPASELAQVKAILLVTWLYAGTVTHYQVQFENMTACRFAAQGVSLHLDAEWSRQSPWKRTFGEKPAVIAQCANLYADEKDPLGLNAGGLK